MTIDDIAEVAGVSKATISRFFNNKELLSKKTQAKIDAVIRKFNYQPNEVARGLSKGTSNSIGIILPRINNLFFSTIMLGIDEGLSKSKYIALICNTHDDLEKEKQYIEKLINQQIAGLIFIGSRYSGEEYSKHIIEVAENIPVLLINEKIENTKVSYIATDEGEGLYKAVCYLNDKGYKDIYFFNGDTLHTTYANKNKGFEKAVRDRKISKHAKVYYADPFESGGYRLMKKILKDKKPEAIIVASDQMAMGVIRAVHESGVSIPKEISIIGFDNTPISNEVYPRLTTVDQKPYNLGKDAAKAIIDKIKSKNQLRVFIDKIPEICVRDSC